MSDKNAGLEDISSSAADTSFVQEQVDDINSDVDEILSDAENEDVEIDNSDVATDATADIQSKKGDKRTIIKPHEKRRAPRSQTQAIGSLTSSINKMAELQAKRLKLQEESENERKREREELLAFRREEAQRNREHELQVARMYMTMMMGAPTQPCHPSLQSWPNMDSQSTPLSPPLLRTPPAPRQYQPYQPYPDTDW